MKPPVLSDPSVALLSLELETGAFSSDWRHCDQVANYLANLASFARTDSFLYANLLSTVLNELLEIVFCRHRPDGVMKCSLVRAGKTDRIELEVPVNDADRSFYRLGVEGAQSSDVGDRYTRSLLGETPPDRTVGLLELATDYGARIWLDQTEAEDRVRLTVDVQLEGPSFANS